MKNKVQQINHKRISFTASFAGILPLISPADYEEPDLALDYIDPQKRELLDLSYQETTMLKNVNNVTSLG